MSHRANPPFMPPRVQDKMTGTTSRVKGVPTDLPTPILPNIGIDPTREALINLHQFISVNAASVVLNLGVDRNVHLALNITAKEYMAHTGYVFMLPHNPNNYTPIMVTSQDQALRVERFWQNQALFRRYTVVGRALKIRSSRRCNQSSCPHWCTSWQILDIFLHSKCSNTYLPPTGKYTKSTSRKMR